MRKQYAVREEIDPSRAKTIGCRSGIASMSIEPEPDGWIIAYGNGGKIDWDAPIYDRIEDALGHIEERDAEDGPILRALPVYVGAATIAGIRQRVAWPHR
jgi:hypothetical protein